MPSLRLTKKLSLFVCKLCYFERKTNKLANELVTVRKQRKQQEQQQYTSKIIPFKIKM